MLRTQPCLYLMIEGGGRRHYCYKVNMLCICGPMNGQGINPTSMEMERINLFWKIVSTLSGLHSVNDLTNCRNFCALFFFYKIL